MRFFPATLLSLLVSVSNCDVIDDVMNADLNRLNVCGAGITFFDKVRTEKKDSIFLHCLSKLMLVLHSVTK